MDRRKATPVANPAQSASRSARRSAWLRGEVTPGARQVAEETPVALIYNASTYAVMMATPSDLEDFAVGFSLTEGIVASRGEIEGLDIVLTDLGVEARVWLDAARAAGLAEQRRRIMGPTGCGLCGVESLETARRAPATVGGDAARLTPEQILRAMADLEAGQALNQATRATHAAGFVPAGGALALTREDVGRHNALDKLIGAMARAGIEGTDGAIVLSSRISVEMVQKSAVARAAFIIAASAPTGLAIQTAHAAEITLIGVARADGFEVFTRPDRIAPGRGGPR